MVDEFLRRAKDAILGPSDEEPRGNRFEPDAANYDDRQFGNVRPASEDPYGDPADQQFGNVRPASEDPYGDPADQQNTW